MTETLTRNPFTDDSVTKTALDTIQTRPAFWVGYSGETITGAETADFLHACREVLEKRGWGRRRQDDDPEFPHLDESLSVKQMVLAMWRYAREALGQDPGPLTLHWAKFEVDDRDAGSVAYAVLDALVAAHTGTRTAQAAAWADRPARTWDEVRSLLDAAAEFARTHGPEGARV